MSSHRDTTDSIPIARRIRNRRQALGLTSAELAKRSEVSPSYISLIESGAKTPPPDLAARIAAILQDDEELYRNWAKAKRLKLDSVREIEGIAALATMARDPEMRRRLSSGVTIGRTPPTEPPPASVAYTMVSEARYEAEQLRDLRTPPSTPVDIPILPPGVDPEEAYAIDAGHLTLDSSLLRHEPGFLFAYELDRDMARRVMGLYVGDYVVLTRLFRSLYSRRIYAVRPPRESASRAGSSPIVLSRVLAKGNALLLVPEGGGMDVETIPLSHPDDWRKIVLGYVLLSIKKWS